MVKSLVVALCAAATLSLGIAQPSAYLAPIDGGVHRPDFLCRFWPSMPGCRR